MPLADSTAARKARIDAGRAAANDDAIVKAVKSAMRPGAHNRLTARAVTLAQRPGPKIRRYADGGGLWLVVGRAGGASWIYRATMPGGARTEMGLGSARAVTLCEARDMAIDAARAVHRGRNPIAEKRARQTAARVVPTFADLAAEVIADKAGENADGGAQWAAEFRKHVYPEIGDMPVSDISANDVLGAVKPMWLSKHETAKRVRTRIKVVFKRAVFKGFRVDNPADNLDGELPKPRKADEHHEALPYAEVANAIARARRSRALESAKAALDFLVLTAARAGETLRAEWSEIDLEAREWRIPAARMKARKEHVVPLSGRAVDILNDMAALREGESTLVFPGAKRGKPMTTLTLRKLLKGLKGSNGKQATIHGFRASFRNWCAETGKPRELAERALAHEVGNRVESAYNRTTLLDARRGLMEEWAGYLAK